MITTPIFGGDIKLPLLIGLALLFSLASCSLKPTSAPTVKAEDASPFTLKVESADPVLKEIVCKAYRDAAYFSRVDCGGDTPKADGRPADLILQVDSKILDTSQDLWRNAGLSLAGLSVLVVVSNSGTVEYEFSWRRNGKRLDTFKSKAEGRAGVWALQPPIWGFVAVFSGTMINGTRAPDLMREKCLKDYTAESESCGLYRDFLTEGFSKIWKKTWAATLKTTVDTKAYGYLR